jgi:hypothetical protein
MSALLDKYEISGVAEGKGTVLGVREVTSVAGYFEFCTASNHFRVRECVHKLSFSMDFDSDLGSLSTSKFSDIVGVAS